MLHLLACLALAAALLALLRSHPAAGGAPQLGHYTLGEKLGEGGGGVVYRAEHVALKRSVAIKLLSPRRTSHVDIRRF